MSDDEMTDEEILHSVLSCISGEENRDDYKYTGLAHYITLENTTEQAFKAKADLQTVVGVLHQMYAELSGCDSDDDYVIKSTGLDVWLTKSEYETLQRLLEGEQ